MTEESYIDKINQAIKSGERARVLFETLLETVGLDIENPEDPGRLFKRLKEVQDDYTAAVNDMRLMIKERMGANKLTHDLEKAGDVSVSNY